MILDQNLNVNLWAEATSTVVYIQNRCPHSHLEDKTPEEVFTKSKPDINHLRIFGCPVYIHVPKEKRLKLKPSGKRGIFEGYSETSKAYRIYIPGQKNIELSRDVIFEEDLAFKRAHSSLDPEVYIPTPSIDRDPTPKLQRENPEETISETQSPPRENLKKRPLWATKTIAEAQKFVAPSGTFRESKRPNKFTSYVALMNDLTKAESNNVSEALEHQVWKDAMSEEYQSIMKNDVWEIVPRPTKKSVVSSNWLFKIKHAANDSIEKHKARFVARGFSQREGIDYEENFAPVARYTLVRAVLAIAAAKRWKVHQMDVKTAFLNGEISEEVYLEQP